MRLTNLIFVFGIIASITYVASLLFRVMHWPFQAPLRYSAYGLIVIGLVLYGIDWYKYRRKAPRAKSFDVDDEHWED